MGNEAVNNNYKKSSKNFGWKYLFKMAWKVIFVAVI